MNLWKNKKLWQNFFLGNVEWNSKKLWKIFADVKTNVKHLELVAVSNKYLQEVPQKLQMHCKEGVYLLLNFG